MTRIADIRALPERGETQEMPPEIIRRKFDFDLLQLIKDRMTVGHYRYGGGRSKWQGRVLNDPLHVTLWRMQSKFIQFLWTRNLEFLVDVLVYGFLLWRFADDRRLHFQATEQDDHVDMIAAADRLAQHIILRHDHPWRSE